jgi:protein phosphatase
MAAVGDDAREDRLTNLKTAARTETGLRGINQDKAVCRDHLVVVADGTGARGGGEIASALAVAIVDAAFSGRSSSELEAAVRAANVAVFERAAADSRMTGMATTLCAVGLTDDGALVVVNVGDSRAYLLRDGSLRQLTTDHRLVTELVQQGKLSADEARNHPQRSIITRVVGVSPTVEVDTTIQQAALGDRLLLCSDGLVNEVADNQIQPLLEQDTDPGVVADALVDLALANGGRDNVTVIIADVRA